MLRARDVRARVQVARWSHVAPLWGHRTHGGRPRAAVPMPTMLMDKKPRPVVYTRERQLPGGNSLLYSFSMVLHRHYDYTAGRRVGGGGGGLLTPLHAASFSFPCWNHWCAAIASREAPTIPFCTAPVYFNRRDFASRLNSFMLARCVP